MERLDDLRYIARLDRSKMRDLIGGLPGQLALARSEVENRRLSLGEDYTSVVIAGMGGSAIGGELASACLSPDLSVPISVVRAYRVPGFVSPKTLFIAVSYSGNTEETLAALHEAKSRGSAIVCVGSGGVLIEIAKSESYPFIIVPSGMPPRCAVGFLATCAMLTIASAFGMSGRLQEIDEAEEVLKQMRTELEPRVSARQNRAKAIAERFVHRLPFIYSSCTFTDPVARRWSTQMNENAKTLCHYNALPELDHNEIVGWGLPRGLSYENSYVLFLDPGDLSARLERRLKVTRDVIAQVTDTDKVEARGEGRFTRLLSLVYLGDYVSFYLAMLNGVDPTPIERIDFLKKKLKEED